MMIDAMVHVVSIIAIAYAVARTDPIVSKHLRVTVVSMPFLTHTVALLRIDLVPLQALLQFVEFLVGHGGCQSSYLVVANHAESHEISIRVLPRTAPDRVAEVVYVKTTALWKSGPQGPDGPLGPPAVYISKAAPLAPGMVTSENLQAPCLPAFVL
jgi:hypothetical protein